MATAPAVPSSYGRANDQSETNLRSNRTRVWDSTYRKRSNDHLSERAGEDKERQYVQKHERSSFVELWIGVLPETERVVVADEDKDGEETLPRELDDDVGDQKGLPGVHL